MNQDGSVTQADFDVVVAELNRTGPRPTGEHTPSRNGEGELAPSLDVNNDGYLSPLDALQITNALDDRNHRQNDASPWLNPENHHDVNGDGQVTPLDVLTIFNEIRQRRFSDADGRLPTDRSAAGEKSPSFDVDGDHRVTENDAKAIIDHFNSRTPLLSTFEEDRGNDHLEALFDDIADDVANAWLA